MSIARTNATKPLSHYHRELHRKTVELARSVRYDGAQHARLLDLARASRFYFEHFRSIGD